MKNSFFEAFLGKGKEGVTDEKNILLQLFDGEICPSNDVGKDPKTCEILHVIGKEKEYFLTILSDTDRDRFVKLDDLYFDASGAYGYECFARGFRLCAALLIEALNGTDEPDGDSGK